MQTPLTAVSDDHVWTQGGPAPPAQTLGRRRKLIKTPRIATVFLPQALYFVARRLFATTTICKPVTSRPASAERYLVCRGLRADPSPDDDDAGAGAGLTCEAAVTMLLQLNATPVLPAQLQPALPVDLSCAAMHRDSAFVAQLRECNDALLRRQLSACKAIGTYAVRQAFFIYDAVHSG
jgi:hypothetical protein